MIIFGYYERDKYAKKIKLAFLPLRICSVPMLHNKHNYAYTEYITVVGGKGGERVMGVGWGGGGGYKPGLSRTGVQKTTDCLPILCTLGPCTC